MGKTFVPTNDPHTKALVSSAEPMMFAKRGETRLRFPKSRKFLPSVDKSHIQGYKEPTGEMLRGFVVDLLEFEMDIWVTR